MTVAITTQKVITLGNLSDGVCKVYCTMTNSGADTSATITPAVLAASTGWPSTSLAVNSFNAIQATNFVAEKALKAVITTNSIALTFASGDSYYLVIDCHQAGVASYG